MLFKRKKVKRVGIRDGYDRWSTSYAAEANPVKTASNEVIIRLLPDLSGKAIVDAGCGSGYFCELSERQGAAHVTGIDFSAGMIEQAKKVCSSTNFLLGDIGTLTLPERSSDVVICALVLGHAEKIEPAIAQFARTLKAGGVLVISEFHPYLSLKGQKRTFVSNGTSFEVPHFIHMVGEYVDVLAKNGLQLEAMEEPLWNEEPVVFALRARKP